MPINTSWDRPGSLRQRGGEGVFTEGAEESNVQTVNEVLDGLFARKADMAKRCEAQLGDLFANKDESYGRARGAGMPAAEASRLVTRAFRE